MIKSILFVGNFNSYSRSLQRYNAFKDLDIQTTGLSLQKPDIYPGKSRKLNLWSRIRSRYGYPSDETNINKRILQAVKREKPQCVWIEKGLMIRPQTLEQVREAGTRNKNCLFF